MQSDYAQQLFQETWRESSEAWGEQAVPQSTAVSPDLSGYTPFRNHFVGAMELRADAPTVNEYLNAHQGWFCRCAHPMAVEPIEQDGYLLTVGRYGSFGFEVEPQIGLRLLPPDDQGVFRIETIPGLTGQCHLYQVNFRAALQLIDAPTDNPAPAVTQVEWTLDLEVSLIFPRFIRRLPAAMIQGTGDRLLQQIVRQVSRRLTAKVQEDFHASFATN